MCLSQNKQCTNIVFPHLLECIVNCQIRPYHPHQCPQHRHLLPHCDQYLFELDCGHMDSYHTDHPHHLYHNQTAWDWTAEGSCPVENKTFNGQKGKTDLISWRKDHIKGSWLETSWLADNLQMLDDGKELGMKCKLETEQKVWKQNKFQGFMISKHASWDYVITLQQCTNITIELTHIHKLKRIINKISHSFIHDSIVVIVLVTCISLAILVKVLLAWIGKAGAIILENKRER